MAAATRPLDGFNLLASTDEWMSPIFADVGPDGAIWVIDFYSFVIQHNPTPSVQSAGIQATTGRGGAYKTENNLRDQTHGRIYRVVWKDGPKSSIKSLAKAKTPELVAALDSGNQFWSLTAQRLIVDNKMTDAAPALKKRVRFRQRAAKARSMPSGRSKASARSTRTRIKKPCSTKTPRSAATPFAPCPRTRPDASSSSAAPSFRIRICSRARLRS